MAFKVGDKVRVVAIASGITDRSDGRLIGAEGVIVRALDACWAPFHWVVDVPGVVGPGGSLLSGTEWACRNADLAPLTPPAEDAWAADAVRKVTKPQHVEPVAPNVERERDFDRLLGN